MHQKCFMHCSENTENVESKIDKLFERYKLPIVVINKPREDKFARIYCSLYYQNLYVFLRKNK